jgi:hypothetical protein
MTEQVKKQKEVSKERLKSIEYALASCAMELNVSQAQIDEGREELLKVARGELSDEDYRANILKKHNLSYRPQFQPQYNNKLNLKKAHNS